MKNNLFKKASMKLALMVLGYFLLVILLYTGFQMIKVRNCLGIVQILSILIPVVFYFIFDQKEEKKKRLGVIGVYLFLLLITPFFFGRTYDLTVDGNSYHKTAIAFMKEGWNPLYEDAKTFQRHNKDVVKFPDDSKIDIWIEHYPKATWIIAANMYDMTGNIESGKCITFLLLVVSVIITYNCLRTILSKHWSIILAVLLALNPIVLAQFFTYYLDSIMGICFVIELLLLFMIHPMKKQNHCIWIALLSICTIFVNLKFTGLLYSGIIAAVFYFYWFFKYRKEKDFFVHFRRITGYFIIVFGTAVFIAGSTSYVKNTIDHHNPLYPLLGNDKVDIITVMQPEVFNETSMPVKFVWSLFSKTENVTYDSGEKPHLKLPLRVYSSEIDSLLLPDIRIGGFGPLFALIFCLTIIPFVIFSILIIRREKEKTKYIVIPVLAILISSIMVGESWWARYIPQLYILPIMSLGLFIYYFKKNSNKYLNIIPGILGLIILLNVSFYFYNYRNLFQAFQSIRTDLNEMANQNSVKLRLGGEVNTVGYYYTLKDYGINYQVVKNIKKENIRYRYYYRLEVDTNETLSKTD